MPSSNTTQSADLIRRLGQFDIDDVDVEVANHPGLAFHIPRRWWVNERFDIHAFNRENHRFIGVHLEVNVGEGRVRNHSGRHVYNLKSLAVSIELMQFAKEVLLAAR